MRIRICCIIFSCCLLAACGFHLRGAVQIAAERQPLYITSADPYSRLNNAFYTELHQHNIQTTRDATQAKILIEIEDEQVDKTVLSVRSNGEVAEYNLNYRLQVILRTQVGEGKHYTLTEQRDLEDNKQQVLGTDLEQAQMISEMRRQVIQRIITIISASQL